MTSQRARHSRVTLDREDADEIAEGIRALGSWLNQAPAEIQDDFTRYAFQDDPTAPGANWYDFSMALAHSWRILCETLDEADATGVTHMSATRTCSSWA
jgi:hypothetical protein